MSSFWSFFPGFAASLLAVLAGTFTALIAWRRSARKADITMSVRRGSVRIELTATGNAEEVQKVVNEILSSLDKEEEGHISTEGETDSEYAVVRAFTEIERAANDLLGPLPETTGAQSPRRGVFQLRKSLRDLGLWSDKEIGKFDNITRLRNTIVHGDSKTMRSASDIRAALLDAEDLLNSLRRQADTTQVEDRHAE